MKKTENIPQHSFRFQNILPEAPEVISGLVESTSSTIILSEGAIQSFNGYRTNSWPMKET
jgi:predicted ester cyclase